MCYIRLPKVLFTIRRPHLRMLRSEGTGASAAGDQLEALSPMMKKMLGSR